MNWTQKLLTRSAPAGRRRGRPDKGTFIMVAIIVVLGAYLFYPNDQHVHMRRASESGGGPHLYVDNVDTNGDGLADYRLFADVSGSGDIGLSSQALDKKKVAEGDVTRSAVANFRPWMFRRWKDWGFNRFLVINDSTRDKFKVDGVFSDSDSNKEATYKLRMARVNAALDRHTNWGPTQMFSPKAYKIAKRYALRGAYSPIVAMSCEISKSHSFAVGNYPSTHPKDKNKTKYMFIVRDKLMTVVSGPPGCVCCTDSLVPFWT